MKYEKAAKEAVFFEEFKGISTIAQRGDSI